MILSLQSSVAGNTARKSLVLQVSHFIHYGHLLPVHTGIRALAKSTPLRLEDKLLDSEVSKHAIRIARGDLNLSDSLNRKTPQTYHSIVSILDSSDPLRVDSTHKSFSVIRSSIHFTAALKNAEKTRTLTEAIRFLQRLDKISQGSLRDASPLAAIAWLNVQEKL